VQGLINSYLLCGQQSSGGKNSCPRKASCCGHREKGIQEEKGEMALFKFLKPSPEHPAERKKILRTV